jgi:hypothetical protein
MAVIIDTDRLVKLHASLRWERSLGLPAPGLAWDLQEERCRVQRAVVEAREAGLTYRLDRAAEALLDPSIVNV